MTLVELIVAVTIVVTLTGMAIPLARVKVRLTKERELRHALIEIRDAIDRYKEAAETGQIPLRYASNGYPQDLDALVNCVDIRGRKVRFLHKIPLDPMTGSPDWGLRSMQDDPGSESWSGDEVFDVFSKSSGTALDETKYRDW